MKFKDLLYQRKSIRNFTGEPITKEQVDAMIEAATRAPNACNFQSWFFYVVADKAMIEKFSPDVYSLDWIKKSSVIIVVCTDSGRLEERFGQRIGNVFATQDTAAATNNILLAAADMGLGGCWIGHFNDDKCRSLLNIPTRLRPVALVPVGRPAEQPPQRPRYPAEKVSVVIGDLR